MKKRYLLSFISPALFLALFLAFGLAAQAQQATQAKPAKGKAAAAKTTQAEAAKAKEPGDEYPRPSKPAKSYTIGVLVPHLSNPHFVGQAYGYIDEAEKLGAKVILHEAGGYQYIERQVSQLEDLIASKVNAIDLVTVSPTALASSVERAAAAGIPVFSCNVVTNSDKIVARVRSDDRTIGRMQADAMAKLLNGKGNVVMLNSAPGVSAFEDRASAFRQRLGEIAPGIKILGQQYSQSTPAEGLRIMEDFMQTYPQIDGVYNGTDTVAIGAAQVISAAGKQGKIRITTTDFQPDTEKFMRNGVIDAAVIQQTVLIGRWCMRATINHLEKRAVPKEINTPLLLVTKDIMTMVDFRGVRAPDGWKPPVR